MRLRMRTSIDLPDALLARIKSRLHKQNITFRALVISALEQTLKEETKPFQLQDASVGNPSQNPVSAEEINRIINEQREPRVPR
jgi:hypothetical protein